MGDLAIAALLMPCGCGIGASGLRAPDCKRDHYEYPKWSPPPVKVKRMQIVEKSSA